MYRWLPLRPILDTSAPEAETAARPADCLLGPSISHTLNTFFQPDTFTFLQQQFWCYYISIIFLYLASNLMLVRSTDGHMGIPSLKCILRFWAEIVALENSTRYVEGLKLDWGALLFLYNTLQRSTTYSQTSL